MHLIRKALLTVETMFHYCSVKCDPHLIFSVKMKRVLGVISIVCYEYGIENNNSWLYVIF